MLSLVRPLSAPSIIRGTVALYARHVVFRPLILLALPLLPSTVVWHWQQISQSRPLLYAGLVIWPVGWLIAIGPVTIATSELCLGRSPDVRRAWRYGFRYIFGRLLGVGLVWIGIVAVPFAIWLAGTVALAAVVGRGPALRMTLFLGLVLLLSILVGVARLLLMTEAVVLEGVRPLRALRRSYALTRSYSIRLLALYGLVCAIPFGAGALLTHAFDAVVALARGVPTDLHTLQGGGFGCVFAVHVLVGWGFSPMPLIASILLYYDLRARKEGYDSAFLLEDLRR
jgi:hypothetical protein